MGHQPSLFLRSYERVTGDEYPMALISVSLQLVCQVSRVVNPNNANSQMICSDRASRLRMNSTGYMTGNFRLFVEYLAALPKWNVYRRQPRAKQDDHS